MSKAPAFQFYPGDWMTDVPLRSCSVAARGLWMDLLCTMWDGSPRGYLRVADRPLTEKNLASLTGVPARLLAGLLAELKANLVVATDESDGAYYSRRMVRDEAVRAMRAAGGHLGGNPNLICAGKVGDKVNLPPNLPPNLRPTPSSPSSSPKIEDKDMGSADAPGGAVSRRSEPRPKAAVIEAVTFYNRATGRRTAPSTQSRFVDPLLAAGVSVSTVKLAILGACLTAFHLGDNDRQRAFLDPKTILRVATYEGHADTARHATFRTVSPFVGRYWSERFGCSENEALERIYRERDACLVEEGDQPIGPAAMYGDRKRGEAWPTQRES